MKGTNTLKFILKTKCQRTERRTSHVDQARNRTRFTVGRDQINYAGKVAKVTTPTEEMLVVKITD